MRQELNVTWRNNLNFFSNPGNHHIELDASPEVGGDDLGLRPKSLLMVALGGCTGMDVISILKKMKVELEYFNVKVEAISVDEHPKRFTEMNVIYEFKGKDIDYEKIEKAVKLSQERYCGVKASFEGAIKMSYKIVIL